jgi:hypothetical protein
LECAHNLTTYDIIILTECWIKDNNRIPSLQGYNSVNTQSNLLKSGGITIYVKNHIHFRQIETNLNYVECEFLIINIPGLKLNIIGIYRHKCYYIQRFLNALGEIMSTKNLNKINHDNVFLGDFNINLMNSNNYETQLYNTLLKHHSYKQQIDQPTRITSRSCTLIDHILIKHNFKRPYHSNVTNYSITDHLGIYIKIDYSEKITFDEKTANNKYYHYSSTLIELFKNKIHTSQVEYIPTYEKFHEKILEIYKNTFPLKNNKKSLKNIPRTPWITKNIINMISHRNFLHRKFRRTRSTNHEIAFRDYAKQVKRLIKNAKNNYTRNMLMTNTDSRSKWKIINNLMMTNKKHNSIDSMNINNATTTDNFKIANHFNTHFANCLTENMNNKQAPKYYCKQNSVSMFLYKVTTFEVWQTILQLKNTKSCQDNDIPAFIWKHIASQICEPLSTYINNSFTSGTFPETLKTAKIIPIYKKGDKNNTSNYRPISILPQMSKVYEKIFLIRLNNFAEKQKLLPRSQYGFRKGHCTKDAIMDLILTVEKLSQKGSKTAALLLDLSKAFDNVNHTILLYKLEKMGIRGNALNWIKSFISKRLIYTSINGTSSNTHLITKSVPQGSIISPILYALYVSDFDQSIKTKTIQYADDMNVIITGKDTTTLSINLENTYKKIADYYNSLQLTLNEDKTEIMYFNKTTEVPNPVTLNNTTIVPTQNIKFLGISINTRLKLTNHIDTTIKKLNQLIPIFYHIRNSTNIQIKYIIYYSFVDPHLNYCDIFLNNSPKGKIQALYKTQKKLIKILFNYPKDYPTKDLFKNLKIQTIQDTININTLRYTTKIYNGKAPSTICSYFTKSNNTRRQQFIQPYYRTSTLHSCLVTTFNTQ